LIEELIRAFLADTSPELLREEIDPKLVADTLGLERHPRLTKKITDHLNNMEVPHTWELNQ
jgi:hypothetical protein